MLPVAEPYFFQLGLLQFNAGRDRDRYFMDVAQTESAAEMPAVNLVFLTRPKPIRSISDPTLK